MIWLLLAVNLIFLIAALLCIRHYFRRITKEISSLTDEFNRNAERNIILLEDKIRKLENPDDNTVFRIKVLHREGLSHAERAEKLGLPLSQVSFVIEFTEQL